uniref:Uncharacterized protein n=1 Tax=Solanum tuberosum TaxID=4113 RepID=M1DCR4_SOLTU
MGKGKGIDIELTEEDLRVKLQRLRQEIQETRKRRIEVEFAIAIARTANAALDAKLAAKMTKCVVIDEEIVVVRKKRDALKYITVMLQKPLGKHSFFNQEANISGPEDTGPEATEEDTGEEIIYRPPLQGHGRKGMRKPPSKHMSLPPVINATIRRRMAWVEAHFIF